MIFTIISIILSSIQHITTKKFIKPQNIYLIKFSVQGKDISAMDSYAIFSKRIIHTNYKAIINSISKILRIDPKQIERLKPLQYHTGATFTFIIEKINSNNTFIDSINRQLTDAINNLILAKAFKKVYEFKYMVDIPIESLSIKKLSDLTVQNKNAYVTEKEMAEIVPELKKIKIVPTNSSDIPTSPRSD